MSLLQFIPGRALVVRWLRDSCAATAIEYGLIAGGISLAVVAGVFLMGGSLSELFTIASGAMAHIATQVSGP